MRVSTEKALKAFCDHCLQSRPLPPTLDCPLDEKDRARCLSLFRVAVKAGWETHRLHSLGVLEETAAKASSLENAACYSHAARLVREITLELEPHAAQGSRLHP